MTALVYRLNDAPDRPAAVGGKAAGLVRLLRAGLTVPDGFVLTAEAFRAFLEENGLDSVEQSGPSLARLREATWPADLHSDTKAALDALRERVGDAPLAVRSSATAEDGVAASFAGQHTTLLNLHGPDAVLDGILTCWASLYSDLAVEYREAHGVRDAAPAMAVVVQALVLAEASGVAFTLDPVSGDRDVVLIDAAWGLGEGIVNGLVTPDHYVVSKPDGIVTVRKVAEQHIKVAPAPSGGTHTEALSDEVATRSVLSDAQATELARLATRIEEVAGLPQDIEWALAEGRFHILQARPVTAATAAPTDVNEWVSEFDTPTAPDTIWTSANVQEVLPDQISPLNASMTLEMVERFGTEPIRRVGLKLKTPDPFSAYFYGRAFLNVSMMLEVADQTPFGSVDAIMDQFFGRTRDPSAKAERPSLAKMARYAAIVPRLLWFQFRMPAEIRRAERIVADFEREMAGQPFADLSPEELIQATEGGLERGGEVAITHVSGGGITSSAFEWLRRCTESWLDDENGALQATLCTGLAALESAQPAYDLWELSRLILASPQLSAAFEPHDGGEIESRLSSLTGDEAAAFRERLALFIERHGHRSVMEAEFAAKSWSEDHPTVFAMIRNYLHAAEASDPKRIEERQRHERERATKESLERLSWWQRPIFRNVLKQAQDWVAMREHTKSLFMRSVQRGRIVSRELAGRLVERGLLDDPWDLYWLTWDEVKALVAGSLDRADAYENIRRRKAEDERNQGVVLPETFRGRPKPIHLADLELPEDQLLRGIAVSPGRITGPARVILDPRKEATIEPGEILVAPVTDAGWTPLFVAAAGVVVDVGGTLSHGSTVAREYGLPAVVNVKHGTRMIQTGQTITVDGTQGVVVLDGES